MIGCWSGCAARRPAAGRRPAKPPPWCGGRMAAEGFGPPDPRESVMRRVATILLAAMAVLVVAGAEAQQPPAAGQRDALLMEGKKTLRQRVLTKPGVAASAQPAQAPQPGARPFDPLTPLYVYGRQAAPGGEAWIEVGRAARGTTEGWIPASKAIEWKHTMTAVIQNPAGRAPLLFYKEKEPLVAMLGGNDIEGEAGRLATVARQPPVPADFPVVAVEPSTHIDIRRRFYLLPILEADQITFQDGREYRLAEVASIPIGERPQAGTGEYSIGVAFVVDTTLSMDPYIGRVRDNLTAVVKRIAGTETGKRVRFSLVGFRNSLDAQPRLEYLAKVFARFADGANPDEFIRRIGEVRATNVDSLSFNEDSFAAIRSALDELDWGDIAARYIVLVTDAGSRPATDRFSATGLGPQEINALAREKGAAIFVLHVKTPQGRNNHQFAERQYMTAASWPNMEPFYFPVANGDVGAFGTEVQKLTAALLRQAEAQGAGAPAAPPGGGAQGNIEDQAALVGHAMRLSWLGRRDGAAAPDVLRAWAVDAYKPGIENFEIRVLLTRNQLNDLAQALRLIIESGRSNMLDANAVFERLQSVAAHLARDPSRLRERGVENLGDVLGEYLDGLPYVSQIATLDRETWRRMGAAAQTEALDTLEARLRAYEEFNRTAELWVAFDGGRDPGEAMFPVPLTLLP